MLKLSRKAVILLLAFATCAQGSENEPEDDVMHPDIDSGPRAVFEEETNAAYWRELAQSILNKHLNESRQNTNIAKNVILFLGDGMSVTTLTAARIHKGGENQELAFDKFPFTGFSKTYCVDKQVADSACSATAYLCGVKANYNTIGVTAAVQKKDCDASLQPENRLDSIAQWAQEKGKATGIVTTTRITHASPAGTYARTANRAWEVDDDIIDDDVDPNKCIDIARQLVETEPGKNLKVIMGGGRRSFRDKSVIDEEGKNGKRTDGLDLIKTWVADHEKIGESKYIWHRDELLAIDTAKTDYLLGLFQSGHMAYNLDNIDEEITSEPTLAEMVEVAIGILSKDDNGYFLFVEGGRIDTAHHDTRAYKALDETLQFSEAIDVAVRLTKEEDTLLVVTSDHSHTMTLSGYAGRGGDILGVSGKGDDGIQKQTLSYANGPGYDVHTKPEGGRVDPTSLNIHKISKKFPATVPLESETHGGEDVGVFARGPYAHLFSGVYEQHAIPHVMAYASCLGDGKTACDERRYNS